MNKSSALPAGLVGKGLAKPAAETPKALAPAQSRVKHTWFADAGIERRLDAFLYQQRLQDNKMTLQEAMTLFIVEALDKRRV